MPLQIIRQDITKMVCDAIVNPTNGKLSPGGGIDLAIHKAAGPKLKDVCNKIGGVSVGNAVITLGFDLKCKYVIHTVGPEYVNGNGGEEKLLRLCYKNSLKLALENKCESVAFPLISSGTYSYPKEIVLRVAIEEITNFLLENELQVYLVVYDKESYRYSEKLFNDVSEYIDDNYVDENSWRNCRRERVPAELYEIDACCAPMAADKAIVGCLLEDMLKEMDDTFAVTLLKLIDLKGINEIECYKRANVSKQTWHKIMNEKDYKPSKNTVIAFAISLKLNLEETQQLLKTVGFTLSNSNKFDVIIEYFIITEQYDIMKINATLFDFDLKPLGV